MNKRIFGRTWKAIQEGAIATTNECILITWSKHRPGYHFRGKRMLASRVVWFLAHGDPGDSLVCHTCNNAWCINRNHLYLGTKSSNAFDLYRDVGTKHVGHVDLSADEVQYIKDSHVRGISQHALARQFGINQMTVSRIIRDQIRKHVN